MLLNLEELLRYLIYKIFDCLMILFLRNKIPVHVVVDPMLSKVLRPHQREVKYINFIFI